MNNSDIKNINKHIKDSISLMWIFGIVELLLSYFILHSVIITSIILAILGGISLVGLILMDKNYENIVIFFKAIVFYIVSISIMIINTLTYIVESNEYNIYFIVSFLFMYIGILFIPLFKLINKDSNKKRTLKESHKKIIVFFSCIGVLSGGYLFKLIDERIVNFIIAIFMYLLGCIFLLAANYIIIDYINNKNNIK